MKKAPVILHIIGTLLAGVAAGAVFLAEHADLLFRSLEREEDPSARTVHYKTKHGSFSVGGTGVKLPGGLSLLLHRKKGNTDLTDSD